MPQIDDLFLNRGKTVNREVSAPAGWVQLASLWKQTGLTFPPRGRNTTADGLGYRGRRSESSSMVTSIISKAYCTVGRFIFASKTKQKSRYPIRKRHVEVSILTYHWKCRSNGVFAVTGCRKQSKIH
jgi:hypothetical protein